MSASLIHRRAPELKARGSDERTVLEVDAIHTYYGLSQALFGVSLEIAAGSASACSGATASARRR